MRFFIDVDGFNHWYIVPITEEKAWTKWKRQDLHSEDYTPMPRGTRRIGGTHDKVTFTEPILRP